MLMMPIFETEKTTMRYERGQMKVWRLTNCKQKELRRKMGSARLTRCRRVPRKFNIYHNA